MFHHTRPRVLLLIACLLVLPWPAFAVNGNPFVRPAELEKDVAFWRRIYTEVTTDGGLIHDPEDLSVVYEVVKFPADMGPRTRSQKIDEVKKKYARILDRLASGAKDLSEEEQHVEALWPKGTSRSRFEQASEEVRFQLGQADRFKEGLIRSGAWRDHIADKFVSMGLPKELSALPHVESSFNTYASSKVGAAGMWQFMRGTGRRFLRIDNTVDERMDPYRATEAAARFLEQNYIVLGSWPLALTAYNHGTAGMRRAKEQLGTDDIAVIVRKYSSRSFGFASRNFYVAFLAALEIDSDPDKFFGSIRRNPVDNSHLLPLPNFMPMSGLAATLDLDREELRRLNPSLLPSVWSGARFIPKGFDLRVPSTIDLTAALDKINRGGIAAPAQVAETQHRVGKGESLSTIASRYAVTIAALADANNLHKPYRVHAGQVLTLPGKSAAPTPPIVVAQIEKPVPQPSAPATGVVGTERYVVKRGDTLGKIATRNGMTEEQLMKLNDIRNRNFVYEGQVLALAQSARAAPPAEAAVPVESASPPPAETVATAEAEEPVSGREAEAEGPSLVPGTESAASADPSDYTVRNDNTIEVQATETLGHYAEWLNVRASQIRKINRMSFATPVVVGHRLKLDFTKVTRDQFEAQRSEYHRQLQEAFFAQYRIKGDETHVIKSGESVWVLAQQRYNVPIWLLRQYNPDVDLGALRPGTKLVIPLVESTAQADSGST